MREGLTGESALLPRSVADCDQRLDSSGEHHACVCHPERYARWPKSSSGLLFYDMATRSLMNLTSMDPGFRQAGVVTASLDLRKANIPEEARAAFNATLIERVRAIPGCRTSQSRTLRARDGLRIGPGVRFAVTQGQVSELFRERS